MAKMNRLMLWGSPNKYGEAEAGATVGAKLGVNLTYNGKLLAPEDILNPAGVTQQQFPVTLWSLIREIPPNVVALENTTTTGLYVITDATLGASATRELQGPQSVKVVNSDGLAGDPSFALDGDVTSPGALFGYGTNMAGAKSWYRPALFESTGLLGGGTLSINAGDNTKFDVSQAVIGQTDYTTNPASPTRAVVVYGPSTANSVPNLAIIATWVGLQMPAGTLVTQSTKFTDTQLRTIIQLGAVISNGTNLIAVNNLPNVMRAGINQIGDLMTAIGPINNGNLIGPNGANLQINKASGVVFKQGANFALNQNDPHNLPLAALTAANFNYRTSTGVQAATTNAINVTQYESPLGTLATVPNNRFTVQRVYVFTSNLIRIQYGQTVYQTMAEAEAAIATQSFATESNIAENGVLLAFLIVEKSATALNNAAQAKFIPADKFGGVVGSGGTSITNTDSLPEGLVNLYFTDARAIAALGNGSGDGTQGQLLRGDNTWSNVLLYGGAVLAAPAAGMKLVSQNNTQSQLFEVITTGAGTTVGPDICSTEYTDTGAGGLFHVRRARGTLAAPSGVLAGDIIGGISGRSYHSGGAFQTSGPASIHWVASENQTATAFGSYMRFYSTPQGTTVRAERMVVTDVGAIWALGSGTFDPKSAAQTQPFGTNTHRFLASAVDEACRITSIGYGAAGTPQVNLAHANGTPAAPTAVVNNDGLGLISSIGYNGAAWVSTGLFRYVATENWTGTANGTDLVLETTANGTTTRSEKLRLKGDGRLFGTALHNNANPVTGTTSQYIASGTYTPTLTNTLNISASVPDVCQWMRVGNVVTVSGTVQIDVAAVGMAQLGFSLPIASAFASVAQAGGSAVSNNESLRIRADTVNARALFEANIKADVANAAFYFSFTYLIV